MSEDLGLYTIPLLLVGEYEVIAKAEGFAETKIESVRVGLGRFKLRQHLGSSGHFS